MNESAQPAGGAKLGTETQWRSVQGGIQASGSRVTLQERGGASDGQDGSDHGNRNPTTIAEFICTDVRPRLNDLIDGALDSSTRQRFERHLLQCRDCSALHDTLEQTVHGLGDLDPVPVPGGMRERLRQHLKEHPSE